MCFQWCPHFFGYRASEVSGALQQFSEGRTAIDDQTSTGPLPPSNLSPGLFAQGGEYGGFRSVVPRGRSVSIFQCAGTSLVRGPFHVHPIVSGQAGLVYDASAQS
jgi:hypothetical protein